MTFIESKPKLTISTNDFEVLENFYNIFREYSPDAIISILENIIYKEPNDFIDIEYEKK